MSGAVVAEPWSLAIGQIGKACVFGALALNIATVIFYVLAPWYEKLAKLAKVTFTTGCAMFVGAFLCVVNLFVNDQFQYKYVFDHASKSTALQYKVAGAWSGQEGSILLWAVASATFGILSASFAGKYRRWFTIAFATFLSSVAAILVNESPFILSPLIEGKAMVPTDGRGLAASLMNYWVVIHPPTIFAGFGSLTVLFSFAIAVLATKDFQTWVPLVRPWTLVSLAILGLGLAMGGFWAYETLGWGGFWMWDPVENTSFVPWVAVAALVHGLYVQVSRKKWHLTNVFLAGLPFLLFCYGTFLTRSGYLGDTSVHSFAEMDRSALRILIAINGVGFGTFIVLWGLTAWKTRLADESRPMKQQPINREFLLGLGIWLLVAFGIVTALGMSVPFLQTIQKKKPIVVEEWLYNSVLSFFFIPLLIAMAIGPLVTWIGLGVRALANRFVYVFAGATFLTGMILFGLRTGFFGLPVDMSSTIKFFMVLQVPRVPWILILVWFCLFALIAALWKLVEDFRKSKSVAKTGGMLAHVGVTVMMLGLVVSRGFEQQSRDPSATSLNDHAFVITPTKPVEMLGVSYRAIGPTKSFIDRDNKVKIEATHNGARAIVTPGLYYLGLDQEGNPMPFIWPSIQSHGLYDMYLVLRDLTFEASGPTPMKTGDQRLLREEGMLITYKGLKTQGPLGQAGAKFIAQVEVQTEMGTFKAEPAMVMTDKGLDKEPAKLNDAYSISLEGMSVNDKTATLQVKYNQAAYVAELYYKPMTLFVWLGVGIMTGGAALSAWQRRRTSEPKDVAKEPNERTVSQE